MKKILVLAAFVCFINACKKKVDKPITPIVVPVLPIDSALIKLTANKWEVYDVKISDNSIWSIPGIIQACMKDDSYQFFKDSFLSAYENAKKCATDDSTRTKWQFIGGTKRVKATLLGQSDTADIISLNETKLQLGLDYNGSPAEIFFRKK